MPSQSTITRTDYENFLGVCYFGSSQDLILACINRAYRDFNRTMHGFGKFENAGDLYEKAALLLRESLENLKSLNVAPMTTEVFDAWHKTTCEKIISLFANQGFHLYVGQA